MPTQQQFNLLKPQDLGLPSFDVVYQVPNLSPEEQSRLLTYMKQADVEKSGVHSSTGPTGGAVTQFKKYYESLLGRQNAYVPPPTTPSNGLSFGGGTQTATQPTQGASVAAVPPPAPKSQSRIDFEAELMKLLGGNTAESEKLQKMQLAQIEKGFGAGDFGPEDQKILDIAKANATKVAAQRTDQGNEVLAGQGLSGGGAMLRNYQAETDRLSQFILDKEVEVRTNALNRGRATRQEAFVNSENFLRALETKNVGLATQLVNLYKAQVDADLNERQLDLQTQAQEESIRLSRDQFTEEKRRALRNEGFTEDQIRNAEQQMLWQRAFNEKQQTADIDLSNRNLDLQTRVQDRTLSQQDKVLALQEIKDNRGFSLETAMQGLKERQFLFSSGLESKQLEEVMKMNDFERTKFLEEMGFERDKFDATHNLSRDQFESYAKELERRFGLDINRFELEKSLSTGELNWKILESQRRFDLDSESERQKWMATTAARELQERLAMSANELQLILQGKELDARRETELLEKWMFQENIKFEKYKFAEQLKAAKAKKKGSFLGGLVKTLVGGAVGFFTGGGPVGALAGAMSANGIDLGIGGGGSSSGSGTQSSTGGGGGTTAYGNLDLVPE